MESDTEAKHLALDFITRCRGEGKTIETVANAAGWILQIIAHADAQRRSRNAAAPDLQTDECRPGSRLITSPLRLSENVRLSPRLDRLERTSAFGAAKSR